MLCFCLLYFCLLYFSDPWLHRKSKKGSRRKSLTGSPDISAADPTFNALAAAGLKVSNMSWSIPSKQEAARQISGINYSRNWPLGNDSLSTTPRSQKSKEFPLVSLFQSESHCEIFVMVISSNFNVNEN